VRVNELKNTTAVIRINLEYLKREKHFKVPPDKRLQKRMFERLDSVV